LQCQCDEEKSDGAHSGSLPRMQCVGLV
jgi:hypothetical protein